MPLGCPRPHVQAIDACIVTMSWQVVGRTKLSRSTLVMGAAIRPARRHQKSATEDILEEHGHHVRFHLTEQSIRLRFGAVTKIIHQGTGDIVRR